MKIRQWELSCSMRADGRTDMRKLIVAFRNVANVPKMGAIKVLEVAKEQLHTCINLTSYDKMNITFF